MAEKHFWDDLRRHLFKGRISAQQKAGIDRIIDCWYAERAGKGVVAELAYILATSYHETNGAMQPNRENLNYTTSAQLMKVWPSRFKTEASTLPYLRKPVALANHVYNGRNGNIPGTDDGWIFRGAGDVHLTGRGNFGFAGDRLGIDLVGHPEKALEPVTSAKILVLGMVEGWFTNTVQKLPDYVNEHGADYLNARRVVNGTFAAREVMAAALIFERACGYL